MTKKFEYADVPRVPLEDFIIKLNEFAKDNLVLKFLYEHDKKFNWETLPGHLLNDLFTRLDCKPIIYKY